MTHTSPSPWIVLCCAALAGLAGALVTFMFRAGIQYALHALSGDPGLGLVATALALPLWLRAALPATGGLLAGLALRYVLNAQQRLDRADYMEAVTVGAGVVPVRSTLVRSFSSWISIVSGGSLGREGAMVQLAAMLGSLIGARMPTGQRRLLVACGAASGMACAYNAPLAGALFVAEVVLGSITMQSLGPLLIAAVTGNQVFHLLWGDVPIFAVPALPQPASWELALCLMLGMFCGVIAPLLLDAIDKARPWFARLPLPLALAAGGAVVGGVSIWVPQVWGNGYSVVSAILHGQWVWQFVLLVLACKLIATWASISSGAVGGLFTPLLFVGAAIGFLLGDGLQQISSLHSAPAVLYAVVGMGAFLAGATQAPLMAIVMVFEMTRSYAMVAPLMVACTAAWLVATQVMQAAPLYHRQRTEPETPGA